MKLSIVKHLLILFFIQIIIGCPGSSSSPPPPSVTQPHTQNRTHPSMDDAQFTNQLKDALNKEDQTALDTLLTNYPTKDVSTMISPDDLLPAYTNKKYDLIRSFMKRGVRFDVLNITFSAIADAIKNPKPLSPWVFPKNDGTKKVSAEVTTFLTDKPGLFGVDLTSLKADILQNFSTIKSRVLVLQKYPDAIFKTAATDDQSARIKGLKQAQAAIAGNPQLSMWKVPDYAHGKVTINSDDHAFVFEQKLSLNGKWDFQKSLYDYLFALAETDTTLKAKMVTLVEELAHLVCRTGLWDVKYDNLPITFDGYGAIVDAEDRTDDTKGSENLLNGVNSNSYLVLPAEYLDKVLAVFKTYNNNVCQANIVPNVMTQDAFVTARAKAEEEYQNSKLMYKKQLDCRIKRGVVDFNEPISLDGLEKLFAPSSTEDTIARSLIMLLNKRLKDTGKRMYGDNIDVSGAIVNFAQGELGIGLSADQIDNPGSKIVVGQKVIDKLIKANYLCEIEYANPATPSLRGAYEVNHIIY